MVDGTRTSTYTDRSTAVHTVVSGSSVSTYHCTPLIWMADCPTTQPAGRPTPHTSTTGGSPQAWAKSESESTRRDGPSSRSRGRTFIRPGQAAPAAGVTGGTSTGSTGRSARSRVEGPETSAGEPLGSSRLPSTLASTTSTTTTGRTAAVTMIAARRIG